MAMTSDLKKRKSFERAVIVDIDWFAKNLSFTHSLDDLPAMDLCFSLNDTRHQLPSSCGTWSYVAQR